MIKKNQTNKCLSLQRNYWVKNNQKLKIKDIDHFVITTADLQACLDFYVGTLGMEHRENNGHHNLYFPGGKISIHTKKGEFQPAALNPTYGSQDFCLIVEDDLETVKRELEHKDYNEDGIVVHDVKRGEDVQLDSA